MHPACLCTRAPSCTSTLDRLTPSLLHYTINRSISKIISKGHSKLKEYGVVEFFTKCRSFQRSDAKGASGRFDIDSSKAALAKRSLPLPTREPAEACYVLASGQVHLIHLDTQGREVTLHIVESGHVLGIAALLEEGAYSTSARVAQASAGLVWSRSEIQRLLHRHPTILSNALHIVMSRYTELQHAYQQLAFETVDRRLASTLVRLAHAVQPEPNGEIIVRGTREQFAALAVTTVSTASRLLSEWERRGWLTSGRMVVVVKDLAALEAMSRGSIS